MDERGDPSRKRKVSKRRLLLLFEKKLGWFPRWRSKHSDTEEQVLELQIDQLMKIAHSCVCPQRTPGTPRPLVGKSGKKENPRSTASPGT